MGLSATNLWRDDASRERRNVSSSSWVTVTLPLRATTFSAAIALGANNIAISRPALTLVRYMKGKTLRIAADLR
ncbi:hypothetical protein HpMS107_33880 [Helicobacter pylori]